MISTHNKRKQFGPAGPTSLRSAAVAVVSEHMKPRFSIGKGSAPRHVCDVLQQGKRARIVIRDEAANESAINCTDNADFSAHITSLIKARVPFSVGGMSPGPAEAVHYWFSENGLPAEYLEISWRGPDDWVVREVVAGATEWQETPLRDLLANNSFQG